MPSTRIPPVVNPGPGKLPTGVVTASALLFQSSSAGATAPLYSPKAIPTSGDFTAGGGGDLSRVITAVGTAWLWTGESLTISATDLYLVCDQNDHPLWVGSTLVQVTSITGAAIGDSFVAGPLTINFNVSIPAATNYRVYYAVRGDLATVPTDVWSEKILRNSAQGAAYLYVDPVNLTTTTLGNITTKTGGVGNTVSNAEQAFENVDSRLTKLRSFVATVTDNSASFGGDHNTASIDDIVFSGLSTLGGGTFIFRPGIYLITNATTSWDVVTTFNVTGTYAFLVADASRTTDCQIASASIVGPAILAGGSTLYKFEAIGNFDWDGQSSGLLTAGSLVLNGSVPDNLLRLKNIQGFTNSVITNATACLEVTGSGHVELSNIAFDETAFPTASTPLAMLYIHDMDEDAITEVSNCRFANTGSLANVDGLRLESCPSQIRFTNCQFLLTTNSTGDSWALRASDCTGIVFENCLFWNDTGQVIKATNSGITFINCQFFGGAGGFGSLANPQLIAGEGNTTNFGFDNTLRFINCKAFFGTDNVKPTGAPTKPIIELGGHDGIGGGVAGPVEVNGLHIQADTGLNVHNFTTVVLWNKSTNPTNNTYRDITIDMAGSIPTNSGTISSASTWVSGGGGHVIEIINNNLNLLIVENLHIRGLGAPAVAVPRSILLASLTDIRVCNLQASASGGAGYYGPLLQFIDCNVTELVTWPDQTNSLIGNDVLRLGQNFTQSHFRECIIALQVMPSPTIPGFAPWALNCETGTTTVFENCTFFNVNGQAVRNVNYGATYINCKFLGGTDTSLTNPQLLGGEGYTRLGESRFSVEAGGSKVAGLWHDASPPSGSFITAGVQPGDWLLVAPGYAAAGLYQISIVAANDLTTTRPLPTDAGPSSYVVYAPGVLFGFYPSSPTLTDDQDALRIVNCEASFGPANVVSGDTDIHLGAPIVELGGHAVPSTGFGQATPCPGRVIVDGLLIKPASVRTGQSGTGATLSAVVGVEVTVTGLSGMTSGHKGKYLKLSNASSPNNNGTFLISAFVSATSVKVVNLYGYGAPDAGSVTWEVLLGPHNYTTVLLHGDGDFADPNTVGGTQRTTHIPNRYSNITVDMLGTPANQYGTNLGISGYNGGISSDGPRILQVYGSRGVILIGTNAGVSVGGSGDPDSKSTITGLTAVTPLHVGRMLRMTKNPGGPSANDGVFQITDYISSTSVKIFNPNGATDAGTGYDWYLEDSSTAKVQVDNLQVVNVGRASGTGATSTVRGIIDIRYAMVNGMVLDGSPFQATRDVTGYYARPLIRFVNVLAKDIQIFPSDGLLSISGSGRVIDADAATHMSGLLYHNRGTDDNWQSLTLTGQTAPGPYFNLGIDCTLDNALVYTDVDVDPSTAYYWIELGGLRSKLTNSSFIMAFYATVGSGVNKASVATSGSTYMVNASADEVHMANNLFRWNSSSALLVDMVNAFGANNSVFIGNSLMSTGTQIPNPITTDPSSSNIEINLEGNSANTGNPDLYT